ncbi:hypothetical protein BS17DRAFT_391696 [Gyrodon lividus]|nr:hypothetical protein BS17DRAFT_391696 [Gyrodon lividus]
MPSNKKRVKRNTNAKEKVQPSGSGKSWLVDIPLEVLMEILQLLEPLDLLHLSRTSNGLRAFFLNRNKSLPFWKTTIRNVKGLPPCPEYITEPAYTYLAFVPLCHGCLAPCDTIKWELRLRCCRGCLSAMTTSISSMSRQNEHQRLPHPIDPREVFIPSTTMEYTEDEYDLGIDLAHFEPTYSRSDWQAWEEGRKQSGVPLTEYVKHQKALSQRVKEHSSLCRDWERKMLQERADLHRRMFDDRRNKLKRSGWKHVLDWLDTEFCSVFGCLEQVRKLHPYTPTEWTEIRPQLVNYLQQLKAERLEWIHPGASLRRFMVLLNIIQPFERQLAEDISLKIRPRGIDMCMFPAVQKIVEHGPKAEPTTHCLMRKLKPVLPRLVREWSADAADAVKALARGQLGLSSRVDPSCHISVVFHCGMCRNMLRFDEALSHPHLYRSTIDHNNSLLPLKAPKVPSYEQPVRDYYRCLPWDCSVLRADVTFFHRINDLVKTLGHKPETAIFDDLQLSGVKVTCDTCRQSRQTAMDFSAAFNHCMEGHLKTSDTLIWTRVVEGV